jgi:hypothetical protein
LRGSGRSGRSPPRVRVRGSGRGRGRVRVRVRVGVRVARACLGEVLR